jgi:hypothetical protein
MYTPASVKWAYVIASIWPTVQLILTEYQLQFLLMLLVYCFSGIELLFVAEDYNLFKIL